MKRRKEDSSPVRTLRIRIKDRHARALETMALAVNLVWNYCNELSMKVLEREQRFSGTSELQRYLAGASKEGLAVGSAVFQQVAEEYVTRRRQFMKKKLAWRKSRGARRSLGWIPFKTRSLVYANGQIQFQGLKLGLWDSYGLKDYELGAGTLSQDTRGRWYINITATARQKAWHQIPLFADEVGIDLGLKDFAATSDGAIIEAQKVYRALEKKLGISQRANKKDRVKAIHAKIANRRKRIIIIS